MDFRVDKVTDYQSNKSAILINKYNISKSKYSQWLDIWKQCFDFTVTGINRKKSAQIYDGTAPDAVDELSSVLVSELAPHSVDWVRLNNKNTKQHCHNTKSMEIEKTIMQSIRNSNFQVEIHQCLLDLVIAGTAVMLVESSGLDTNNPLQFTAISLENVILDDSGSGVIDTMYRSKIYNYTDIITKYSTAKNIIGEDNNKKYKVLETIVPIINNGIKKWEYTVLLHGDGDNSDDVDSHKILETAVYKTCPFIVFRWQKIAGELYGRSPVMKALPDIKTANKIVELTLKNAAISVTGIWQADDDGVLNPHNIRLVPGAIIPKAIGSGGLQPLKSPGDFNLSNLLLDSLQNRIRKSLLSDVFTTTIGRTATEVQEHSIRSRQILNSVFERITQEGMEPLIKRVVSILENKGLIENLQNMELYVDVVSPIERISGIQKVLSVQKFLNDSINYQDKIHNVIDIEKTIRWAVSELGIPDDIIIPINDDYHMNNDSNNSLLLEKLESYLQPYLQTMPDDSVAGDVDLNNVISNLDNLENGNLNHSDLIMLLKTLLRKNTDKSSSIDGQ